MAYDVSTLPAYVEQNRGEILGKALLTAKTIDIINRMSGVKGAEALNLLDVTAPLQDGRECSFTPNGDDKFSQRMMQTTLLKVNKEWCWKKLIGYWTEESMRNRIKAGDKSLDFEEFITDRITKEVANQIEDIAWKGLDDPAIVGLLEQFTTAGETVLTLSGASAYDKVLEVYNAIPEAVLDRAAIFVSPSVFRALVQNLVSANLYHYNPEAPKDELYIPGTDTRVVKVNGLMNAEASGMSDLIVAADPMNLFYGYDVEDSISAFDLWYSKDNDTIRLRMLTNIGLQIAFPDEVVVGGSPSNP